MGIHDLSNEKLIELYCAAKKLEVSIDFLKLLETEIVSRKLSIDRLVK